MQVRWNQLCHQLDLVDADAAVWERLRAAYTEPWRVYHNLEHIRDCLAQCDAVAEVVPDRRALEAALWFHDVVYVIGAAGNEARSAAMARACLSSLGAPPAFIARVALLIAATDHRYVPADAEAQLICDLDLSILGRSPDEYDHYAAAIQAEVGLPTTEFAPHRRAFLVAMLTRPRLFHTAHFRERYEAPARENLRREIEHWERRDFG